MDKGKVLISGSSGFIGRHLTKTLLSKGYDVCPLVHNLLAPHRIEELKDSIEAYKPDYIYHLAAYGNMSDQKDIGEILISNVIGTMMLLAATKNIPFKAFINFGTSSEYGKKDIPMTEDMLPETDTFYGASKVAATYLSRAFAKQFCKPIVTVRPFSVYGPGEAEFRFIPQVIKHLKEGKVMNVDTEGVHDWIYIDDFVNGVLKVTENAHKLFGEVVNIGTGLEHTNQQVIGALEYLSRKKLEINVFNNTRPNDSKTWVDGSGKLRELGWNDKVSLGEGLNKTYEYYK